MTPVGKYLYGIVRCSEERAFPSVAPIGEALGPVHTVRYDGLAAAVSDTASREYPSTRANMLAHARVQEQVMRELPLLPVRFGTVTPGSEAAALTELRRLLAARSEEFHRLLAEMEGKVELGLRAFWRNEGTLFDEILAEAPEVRRLRDALLGRPSAVVRVEGRRLGEMVRAALERKRSAEAAAMLAPLRSLAFRVREGAVVADRGIVNAAFLVAGAREAEFDGAVRQLEERCGSRVALKYVGPVPPYNFVEVVVRWEES